MEKNAKIYVAGHRGMVGSALYENCNARDIRISSHARTKNWT